MILQSLLGTLVYVFIAGLTSTVVFMLLRNRLPAVPRSMILCILLMSFLIMIPRLPFLTIPFSKQIHFPYIGDETKHIAVLTSIDSANSFILRFPYDPTVPFPYYYFFYLLPGLILKFFPHANAGILWFTHVLISQIITYFIIAIVICRLSQKTWIRAIGIGLSVFGSSFKIIPKLFHFWGISEQHIEHWWQIPGNPFFGKPGLIGWQITHPMTLAVWTPQHQWAATLSLLIFVLVIREKRSISNFATVSIFFAMLLGTSAFVAAGMFIAVGVYAVIASRSVRDYVRWGVAMLTPIVLMLPILLVFSQNQAKIHVAPYLPILPHVATLPGLFLFYGIETGFVIPIILLLLFKGVKRTKTLMFLLIATFLPLIISRFVVSDFMNDIGMRIPIVYTTFMPLLIVYLLDQAKKVERITKILLILSITMGAIAGLTEIYFQSMKTETYSPDISRLYQVIARFTNPQDVIVMNDAYLADRLPLFAMRMTIKPEIPFSMDVYVPKRETVRVKYETAVCPIFNTLWKTTNLPIIYAELPNIQPLPCTEIMFLKKNAPVLFSSPSVILYRLR